MTDSGDFVSPSEFSANLPFYLELLMSLIINDGNAIVIIPSNVEGLRGIRPNDAVKLAAGATQNFDASPNPDHDWVVVWSTDLGCYVAVTHRHARELKKLGGYQA